MSPETIQADANATLERLRAKHPDLTKTLQKAHGFAVFPSMGRAGVVLGGAFGRGAVYEQGQPIGFASLSQMTIGVQVGGQTFSELIIFPKKPQLDQYKHGKASFNANASAVLVKGAASGTADSGGVTAHAYSRGGMLLELSLGGQKFTFIPPEKMAEIARKKARRAERKEKGKELEAAGAEHPGAGLGELFRQHRVAGTLIGLGLTGVGLAGVGLAATALTSRQRASQQLSEGRQS